MKHLKLFALLTLLAFLPTPLFAANEQVRNAIPLGFLASGANTLTATVALSTAAGAGGWNTAVTGDCITCSAAGLGYGFVPTQAKQISKIIAYASAEGGTVVAADLRAALWSDSGTGVPNTGSALIEEKTASADQTGAGWQEFTGFTATSTLVAGTQYWIVLRNANTTPLTNFPTYRHTGTGSMPNTMNAATATYGFHKVHTTDAGVTWGTPVTSVGGWRIEFSDGTFMGAPISNLAQTSADYVYANREAGCRFVTPAGATMNIMGAIFPIARTGSTAGNMRFRLYSGNTSTPTLLATTPAINRTNISTTGAWISAFFSTPQPVTGGTTLRVVWSNSTSGGDTSNAYTGYTYTIENSAGSKALFSFGGTGFQKTYTTDSTANPVTFTDTDTSLLSCGVLLDTNGEFVAPTGGGGGVIGG